MTLGKPFAVSKHEVTWDDWDTCVSLRGCDGAPTWDSGYGRGQRPVINVSWEQAKQYVRWLSHLTGREYRLLSEAEWEYAARGITNVDMPHPPYPWGDKASHEHANYGEDTCCQGAAAGRDQWIETAPVGQFPANAFGLHDMHGNAWEWVEDCWNDTYAKKPETLKRTGGAWTDGECRVRVGRGGSWNGNWVGLRSADRNRAIAVERGNAAGFRVARTLEQ